MPPRTFLAGLSLSLALCVVAAGGEFPPDSVPKWDSTADATAPPAALGERFDAAANLVDGAGINDAAAARPGSDANQYTRTGTPGEVPQGGSTASDPPLHSSRRQSDRFGDPGQPARQLPRSPTAFEPEEGATALRPPAFGPATDATSSRRDAAVNFAGFRHLGRSQAADGGPSATLPAEQVAAELDRQSPVPPAEMAATQSSVEGNPSAATAETNANAPLPIPLPSKESVPLRPPGETRESNSSTGLGLSPVQIGSSLAVVVGLFLVVAWLLRRNMPRAARPLSSEVVQLLGRVPLAGKQQLHLLRFGNKLVLVSVFNGGAETVSEITDPQEIDRVLGLCQQGKTGSSTEAFREALQQYASSHQREPAHSPAPAHDSIVEYHRESLNRGRLSRG